MMERQTVGQFVFFQSWERIVLGCAAVAGLEVALLVLIITLQRRPRRDYLVALPPAALFAWALFVARSFRTAERYWSGYQAFLTAHAIPLRDVTMSLGDLQTAAAQQGEMVIGLLLATLLLEAITLLHWRIQLQRGRVPGMTTIVSGDERLEITVERLPRQEDARG